MNKKQEGSYIEDILGEFSLELTSEFEHDLIEAYRAAPSQDTIEKYLNSYRQRYFNAVITYGISSKDY